MIMVNMIVNMMIVMNINMDNIMVDDYDRNDVVLKFVIDGVHCLC